MFNIKCYVYVVNELDYDLRNTGSVPWATWWTSPQNANSSGCGKPTNEWASGRSISQQKPDQGILFFGPCKRRMRRAIDKELSYGDVSSNDIHIIGLTPSDVANEINDGKRQVYFYFHVRDACSFEEAYRKSQAQPELENLLQKAIHIKPKPNNQVEIPFKCRGYTEINYDHIPNRPHDDDWIKDILAGRYLPDEGRFSGKCAAWSGPDLCFFSTPKSIIWGSSSKTIPDEMVTILDEVQKDKLVKISTKNPMYHYRGNHIEIEGDLAEKLVQVIIDIPLPGIEK